MNDSKDHKAAAEPPLDCRVGHGAWGRDDLMALAAVRYCLGRSSYIVGDCVDWLHNQWPNMSASIKRTIARDVDEAIARDNEARERGQEHKPLGWDCDRSEWMRARELWVPNAPGKPTAANEQNKGNEC